MGGALIVLGPIVDIRSYFFVQPISDGGTDKLVFVGKQFIQQINPLFVYFTRQLSLKIKEIDDPSQQKHVSDEFEL